LDIRLKRAYDDPADNDGHRVLVDAMWPRGVSKETAQLDDWMKDVAPSDELRKWFGHDPEKWDDFRKRYHGELDDNDAVNGLIDRAREGRVTLVYAAKDEDHNNAIALRDYLRKNA